MGVPRNRATRSNPQRSQWLSAVLSGGAVAAVAAAFALAGVDDVEVLATLLFAPVFVAALLGGRNAGYAAAAAATLGYLALRYGDIGESGALRVAVLVGARALCYGLVARATPSFRFLGGSKAAVADRFGDGSARVAADDPAPVRVRARDVGETQTTAWDDVASSSWPDPAPAAVATDDREPVPVAAGWMAPPPAEADWGPPADEAAAWGAAPDAAPAWGPPEGSGWDQPAPRADWEPAPGDPVWAGAGAPPWDPPPAAHPAAPGESLPMAPEWDPGAVAAGEWDPPPGGPPDMWADPPAPAPPAPPEERYQAPPAPTVPTGWVDDATVPLGDETIPVGYTGELFLPRDLPEQPYPGPPGVSSNGSTNGSRVPAPSLPSSPLSSPLTSPAGPPSSEPPPAGPRPSSPSPSPSSPVGSGSQAPPARSEWHPAATAPDPVPASAGVDPETRLWNARYFRDRLTAARDEARQAGAPFSVVMVQVADQPFQVLPYRRQVALLRELGHQFIQARMIDHLVHLPDGAQHWFAVVLPGADRATAHQLERRLRSAIASYLRSRGLQLGEVQSASLTSPDDDQAMGSIWASLLGSTSVR